MILYTNEVGHPIRDRSVNPGGSIEEDIKMTTKVTTFSLRLPISLKAAVERLAAADGTSMNQFLVMAAFSRGVNFA